MVLLNKTSTEVTALGNKLDESSGNRSLPAKISYLERRTQTLKKSIKRTALNDLTNDETRMKLRNFPRGSSDAAKSDEGNTREIFVAPRSESRVLKGHHLVFIAKKQNLYTGKTDMKKDHDDNVAVVLKRLSPDFSNFPDSSRESSVRLVKSSKIPKERSIGNINFSVPFDASNESVPLRVAVGCLRRMRKNQTPLKEPNFSNLPSIEDSLQLVSKNKKLFESGPMAPSFSTPPEECNSRRMRGRRCSTPIDQRSLVDFGEEPNLSVIVPPSLDSNQMPSKTIFSAASVPPPSSPQVPDREENLNAVGNDMSDNSSRIPESISFVANVFAPKVESESEIVRTMKKPKSPVKRRLKSPVHKPSFPSFAPFCNVRFYKFLIRKMESKYGIRTNKMVVKVAQYVRDVVDDVLSIDDDYEEHVHRLKASLYRKSVIRTEYDFHCFCLGFLPPLFILKAVPIVQPGRQTLIPWNPDSLFNSVKL